MALDFNHEALIVEAVNAGAACRGAVGYSDLASMEWPEYELAIRESYEVAKRMREAPGVGAE